MSGGPADCARLDGFVRDWIGVPMLGDALRAAIEALEALGTPEAVTTLEHLAEWIRAQPFRKQARKAAEMGRWRLTSA